VLSHPDSLDEPPVMIPEAAGVTPETEKNLYYFTYRETPSGMFNAAQQRVASSSPFPRTSLPL
jgi:hypothetical protein